VFLDQNGNGRWDRSERGVRGVSVSNGLDVVQTDDHGNYRIPLQPESGTPPVAEWQNPVIDPTGPLPSAINFPLLLGMRDVTEFRVMGFADTQAGTQEEEDGVREDIVAPIINNPFGAALGFVAGDVVNDNLALFPRHNEIMGKIGIPIWNVPGNHDTNNESPTDRYATQTYSRYYGPTDFSFNHGQTHFIGADNIDDGDDDRPSLGCVLNERQLQWMRNDLKFVPRHKLIVLVTHCPLITHALDENGERYSLGGNINTINLAQIVEILKPFPRVYAIAGHDTSNSGKVQLNHTHNWHGEWFLSPPSRRSAATAGARVRAPSVTRAR
jgi:3',5'-cyclic AMP phosphodiesterase CpdA